MPCSPRLAPLAYALVLPPLASYVGLKAYRTRSFLSCFLFMRPIDKIRRLFLHEEQERAGRALGNADKDRENKNQSPDITGALRLLAELRRYQRKLH